jgi:hypothetical protein
VLEKQFPPASRPAITFRDFQLEVLPSKNVRAMHLHSALAAVEESVRCTYSKSDSFTVADHQIKIRDIGIALVTGNLAEALATIGYEIQNALREKDREYTLGIILPGASQIFWPELRKHGERKCVFIKVREVILTHRIGMQTIMTKDCKFEPAKQGRMFEGVELVQTVHFVDLPPEIRNMIYNRILERDGVPQNKDRMRQKQPPMSLTCRLVNKEMMSLLFQKYG